jgi:hypothetical protein
MKKETVKEAEEEEKEDTFLTSFSVHLIIKQTITCAL